MAVIAMLVLVVGLLAPCDLVCQMPSSSGAAVCCPVNCHHASHAVDALSAVRCAHADNSVVAAAEDADVALKTWTLQHGMAFIARMDASMMDAVLPSSHEGGSATSEAVSPPLVSVAMPLRV